MLMTCAPMLAACTTARARLRSEPAVCVRVRVVGVLACAHRLEGFGRLPQRQDAGVGRDADEPVRRRGPAGDDRRGQRAVRIAVGHAVAGLVDEIAARLGGHPRRALDPGVDHRDSYPRARCELLRLAEPQVVICPRLVGEVRVRKHRRRRADATLFGRLVGSRLVGRHGRRIDRGRLDRRRGGSAEQRQQQRCQQHTDAVHALRTSLDAGPAGSVLARPQQTLRRTHGRRKFSRQADWLIARSQS